MATEAAQEPANLTEQQVAPEAHAKKERETVPVIVPDNGSVKIPDGAGPAPAAPTPPVVVEEPAKEAAKEAEPASEPASEPVTEPAKETAETEQAKIEEGKSVSSQVR